MKKFFNVLFMVSALLAFSISSEPSPLELVSRLVTSGHWQEAEKAISTALQNEGLNFHTRQGLLFQRERMRRLALDFNKNCDQVLQEMQRIVPEVNATMLDKWEKAGSVECLIVDGGKRYFSEAAANVFRVNSQARALKERRTPPMNKTWLAMRENIAEIIRRHDRNGETLCDPRRFRVEYTLTVKADAVPAGEILRAWLPFPQEGGRQRDVRLLESDPAHGWIAPESRAQRSVYLEKTAVAGEPTRFRITFQYTSSGFYRHLDEREVRPVEPVNGGPEIADSLGERPPHVVFTPELRALSRQIIGDEKNPLAQARLIFIWMNGHVPWAAAREYSTIDNISDYARRHSWGDCGIQTLLFITLCRLNNIPARWESGWTTGANWNMHDWSQIYLAPYGWIPVDVSYGLMPSPDQRQRFFYFGNIDSHRLVVNRDYSQALYPAKVFFRSETVDFQRGEVEWAGGNLYFDQWDWHYKAEPVTP